MNSRTRPLLILVLALMLVVASMLLAGCEGIGDGISTTEGGDQSTVTSEAPEATVTTEAPETTVSSEETATTAAPDTGEETWTTRRYILIGILALAFIVIVIVAIRASRSGKREKGEAALPAWRPTAEQAYSQSRWLYENLTAEIAQWRGEVLHKSGGQAPGQTPSIASAQEQTWSQLGTQMTAAITNLYNLEAQVDPASQPVVRSVIDGLNGTRTAVDEVSSARLAVLQATDQFQGDPGNQQLQQSLAAAHERENQSVQSLNGHRSVLYGALTNLTALR